MSVSPDRPAPRAPYVEDYDDSQDEKSAAPIRANTAKKVTRRDEASDSGYSSHTVATGSSSQGSRGKHPPPADKGGFFSRMGKKSTPVPKKASPKETTTTKETTPESPVSPKTTRLGRATKKDDLRSAAAAAGSDSRKPSAHKKRPAIPPVETKRLERRESTSRPASASRPRPPPVVYHDSPPMVSPPLPDPRPRMYPARPRPYSYYEGMSAGPPVPLGYHDAAPIYPHAMPPGVYAAPGPSHPYPHPMLQPASPTNKVINYSMPPTAPPYASPQWNGPYAPPPSSRRSSMVIYPPIPQGHGWQDRQYGLHNGYVPEYAPMESAAGYDTALLTQDEESFYRQQRAAELMPPPPRPIRPALAARSNTVTAAVRPRRPPQETRINQAPRVSQSPRHSSFDANSRPSSRPGPAHRSSHSSGEQAPLPTAPSPTARRRTTGHSRPTSYHEGHDKYSAAEAYQERTGTASTQMTADAVKNVVKQKSSSAATKTKQTKSTRSHSSRTSSKSSDPKKKAASTEKSRESGSREGVTVKIGKMVLGVTGGRSFHVRQSDDNVHIRLDEKPSRSRDGRGKDRAQSTKYQAGGSTNSRGERGERGDVEVHRSSRPRSRSHSRRRTTTNEESSVTATAGDGEPIERTRTQSRTRRSSSRSGRRPVLHD